MSPSVSQAAVRPFGTLPILRRGSRWLLAAGGGTAPADHALALELDRFEAAMAAAERTVAALPSQSRGRR